MQLWLQKEEGKRDSSRLRPYVFSCPLFWLRSLFIDMNLMEKGRPSSYSMTALTYLAEKKKENTGVHSRHLLFISWLSDIADLAYRRYFFPGVSCGRWGLSFFHILLWDARHGVSPSSLSRSAASLVLLSSGGGQHLLASLQQRGFRQTGERP